MRAPFLFRVYQFATYLSGPFAYLRERRKLSRFKVPKTRHAEKRGRASIERPPGRPLIWFHAASVGEAVSLLALINQMGKRLPKALFLLTSGTPTSAQVVLDRLPPRTLHQFAPLDSPAYVKRFLRHWQPDAGCFVESELWPNLLHQSYQRGVKLALLNARMSERSLSNWAKRPHAARFVFGMFSLILTQNQKIANAMAALPIDPGRIEEGQNLKSFSGPLPIDNETRQQAQASIGKRPVWIASSTHKGEEEIILDAHCQLLKSRPGLLLILIPRHPERGDDVASLIRKAGLEMTRRSSGQMLGGQVFLADTMGELGTWYSLSQIVFLGGSLLPIGGHNLFEVAQSGACILSGPHVSAFAETYADLDARGGLRLVNAADDLAQKVGALLESPTERDKMLSALAGFNQSGEEALDTLTQKVLSALEVSH